MDIIQVTSYHYLNMEGDRMGRSPPKMFDENILIVRYDFFLL